MNLTREEAQNIVWEDTSDFKMIERNIVDTRRWSTVYEGICQHIESGKYYELGWSEGSTEMQDESPFEYDSEPIQLHEVEQKEVLVTKWVSVKKD